MTKVVNIVLILGLLAYMFAALSFTAMKNSEMMCRELKINLFDTVYSGFYGKADIEKMLIGKGNKILGYPVKEINTRQMEKKLMSSPYIREAEIYASIDGVMEVDVTQRKPVVRIITRSQNSYYLDEDGYILPARGNFSPHILVANGYFTEDSDLQKVPNLDSLSDRKKYREWYGALKLARFIGEDSFWKNQVVQLYFNRHQDFELIPRVGAHQIIFGDADDYRIKFKKLKTLYDEGLKYEGWNNYDKINLKYKNQVICTKR